jgi:hypothetical protein
MKFAWVENGKVTGYSRLRSDSLQLELDDDDPLIVEYKNKAEARSNLLTEKRFVSAELSWSDIQIAYHEDGDDRAISTIENIRQYRKDLRNYIKNNVVGIKPVRPED